GTVTRTLTISTTASTPVGTHPFTVTATRGANCQGNGSEKVSTSLVVAQQCTVPVVTAPTNQTVTYGNSATFSASATGVPAPTVQWQVSTDGGTSWNNVQGATTTSLTLTQPGVSLSGNRYRAVFTPS